jgi:hypothetical protein
MSYFSHVRSMLAPELQHPGQRLWPQLVLVVFLLLAQTGLFLHELEHQSTAPDSACALCLAVQHLGDALHQAQPHGFWSLPTLSPTPFGVLPLRASPSVPFSARAPPDRS